MTQDAQPVGTPEGQVSHDELAGMAAPDIATAYSEGRLQHVMTTAPGPTLEAAPPAGQIDQVNLSAMTPADIVAALDAGQLDHLLGRTGSPDRRSVR